MIDHEAIGLAAVDHVSEAHIESERFGVVDVARMQCLERPFIDTSDVNDDGDDGFVRIMRAKASY